MRGLDYYTRTVFEVQADAGSARRTRSAGAGATTASWRSTAARPRPGSGFALGFERTLLALEAAGVEVPAPPLAEVYVARVDDSVAGEVSRSSQALRDAGSPPRWTTRRARSSRSSSRPTGSARASSSIVGPDELAARRGHACATWARRTETRVACVDVARAVLARSLG